MLSPGRERGGLAVTVSPTIFLRERLRRTTASQVAHVTWSNLASLELEHNLSYAGVVGE